MLDAVGAAVTIFVQTFAKLNAIAKPTESAGPARGHMARRVPRDRSYSPL